MSHPHAVVWLDHHQAHIVQFTLDPKAGQNESQQLSERPVQTKQNNSAVRTEHEFFGEVCDALKSIAQVLITSGHTTQSDFKHYLEKHRPLLLANIAGWQTVDHPSDGELVALARQYFVQHTRMAAPAKAS